MMTSLYTKYLQVWGYEPMRVHDNVSIPWSNVADMNITADQLISCAIDNSKVTVWVVDIPVSCRRKTTH